MAPKNAKLTLADRIELKDLADSLRFDFDHVLFPLSPYVSGIEVTQSIQYYKANLHLTDPNDREPDNSLGIAAYKPAWVRVYVRSGFFVGNVTLTGKLVVERQVSILPVLWAPVGDFTPVAPGTVTAQQSTNYATERSSLSASLNFILPADAVHGRLRITAIIWPSGGSEVSPSDTEEVYVDATLRQTLRVRGILVSYNGPNASGTVANMNLAAPTVADLQTSSGNTLTVYPVESTGVFSSGGTISWSTPLTGLATNPGGCSQQWLDLNVQIAQAKANDGNRSDVLYVGLIPANVPIANVGGCNSSGVSAVPNGQQWTMAHELGHAAGLSHGPCGTPGDPNYPAYEPYDPPNSPTASLGEYGLDINNGTIHLPGEKDYMSYCGPVWISLYHYGRLYNNSKLDPRSVDVPHRPHIPELYDPWLWPWEYIPDPPSWELPSHFVNVMVQPVISIVGVVDLTGQVNVSSVMRVNAVGKVREGTPTDLVAELVGANGETVTRSVVMKTDAHGSGCGCGGHEHEEGEMSTGYAFQAMLSDVEPGSQLRIVKISVEQGAERTEMWSRKPSGPAPTVRNVTVKLDKEGATISWQLKETSKSALESSIQFSKDKGVSWNGLVAGLRENKYRTPLSVLPSGSLLFRVLVHDGFYTSTGTSKAVRVEPRPPVVSILHPYEKRSYIAGTPMRFLAAANTHVGAVNPNLELVWYLDGKKVGTGVECWVDAPKSGRHKCRVVAKDEGGTSEATVNFLTENLTDGRNKNEK